MMRRYFAFGAVPTLKLGGAILSKVLRSCVYSARLFRFLCCALAVGADACGPRWQEQTDSVPLCVAAAASFFLCGHVSRELVHAETIEGNEDQVRASYFGQRR